MEPGEQLGEIVFGLIMVLTFTLGAGLVVREGREATAQMLLGILGCNIAWGVIDGGMHIMGAMFERSRNARLLQVLKRAATDREAIDVVRRDLEDVIVPLTSADIRDSLYRNIAHHLRRLNPGPTRIRKEDIWGAFGCLYLVFLTAIPAVIPFLIVEDRFLALRVSNVLLIAILFGVGFAWGRATNARPWRTGSVLSLAGIVMVGVAMALGG